MIQSVVLALTVFGATGASASMTYMEYKEYKEGGEYGDLEMQMAYDDAPQMELNQLETARLTQAAQRVEFGVDGDASAFKFSFSDPEVTAVSDNAAVLQQRVTKGTNVFLSTLAEPGEAQFLTVLKPCSILLPHTHPRANEFYSVIFGTMDAGISQENGAAQDITFEVDPGEVFVVPTGLLHHNHNDQCIPNVFLQSFTSSDPGALNVIGALAAMNAGSEAGAAAILASGADLVEASPQGAFALDPVCLKQCGFPSTGAPGDGLKDLPSDFRVLFGLDKPAKAAKKDHGKYAKKY